MNTYAWYLLFNSNEFLATGLVSRTLTLELAEIGLKDILITKGELFGVLYEGIFLPIGLNEKNPFEFEGHAVYQSESGDVYLGVPVDET